MACCEEFAKSTGKLLSVSALSVAYPTRAIAQMEYDKEAGAWGVLGCCGGNCYVLTGVKFCPFCGASLGK